MGRSRQFDTDNILDKAINLFWNSGFNGVSTEELMVKFGISKSSMYGFFGSKMQLYLSALEKYRKRMYDDTKQRLEHCTKVKKEIANILKDIADAALKDNDHKGCFVVNSICEMAAHERKISKMLQDHRSGMEMLFAGAIRRGIANGEISGKIKPDSVSKMICNTINGIQVDARYLNDRSHFIDIINSVMKLLD
jgi:TetR/AcrR family transcriptional regulator, transcriptional repressor for nem operon